jgi:hypothetical protein
MKNNKDKSFWNQMSWNELVEEAIKIKADTTIECPNMGLRQKTSLKSQMEHYKKVFNLSSIDVISFIEETAAGQGYGEYSYRTPFMYTTEKINLLNCYEFPETLEALDLIVHKHKLKLKQEKIDQANKSKETKKEIELLKALKKKYPNE